jgi:glycerophosphoryl diester phosphodiesterase
MIVLSHRGYWLEPSEKNTRTAFLRSAQLGFGTEIDVRDLAGQLVISHDPPHGGEMSLAEFLALWSDWSLPLAINVKADGLAQPLKVAMERTGLTDWFAFDMAIPDALQQLRHGVPIFARLSEYEPEPQPLIERAAGVWLDGFHGEWWDADLLRRLLDAGKRVCVVSPELHGREPTAAWDRLIPLAGTPGLMICTDLPERAREVFERGLDT